MSTPTTNQPDSETRSLESIRREQQAHRNLMNAHRDTLRAAERTISLLREQIRLHDERARLSIASLVPSPAPVGTPARTPTQRAALERSLSSRIASLQADIERQQFRAGSVVLNRRPETEALAEERNNRRSIPRIPARLNPNACPPIPYSSVNNNTNSNRTYSGRSSSDRGLAGGRQRDGILSASGRLSLTEVYRHHHLNSCLALTGSPSSSPTQHAMEREWERQLADGEVDSNGTPILPNRLPKNSTDSSNTTLRSISSSDRSATTYLGRRKVDGLGLQLAIVASSSSSPPSSSSSASSSPHSNHTSTHHQLSLSINSPPLCLR
ncbi:hypothetical protein MJO28_016260 [Puccinia striiformis f. sp. tritici]|uniref:Uncharacterized protein n=1 Tax=Puccinia striiformis f. sp. tritici TaxID=168172 RepID=A0ACC0DML5_9BASI|nr:hypothetical protein Pst134EB_031142 [Puccinia striiformis f. sp. tritici]KAI7935095.1 hypothetical protein MJO29_016358 [Puccinia striiformis f. sp. tritici]KAI7935389.1 hypothetical protein MJO28_016260 [Puccinia striiformis f. sp. tritici]KAI9601966.1 hypothetical protein KEM48_001255 [Puccinia striiformis f. sp. tritici PST-130]